MPRGPGSPDQSAPRPLNLAFSVDGGGRYAAVDRPSRSTLGIVTFSLEPPGRGDNPLSMADYRRRVARVKDDLWPDGRTLFYEGDDPDGFADGAHRTIR